MTAFTPSAAASATASAPRSRSRRRVRPRNLLLFLLLAGPNVALLLLFVYRPLVLSFYYSMLQWNLGSNIARFVGFGNYVEWFTNPDTPQVLLTTAIFAVTTVGGGLLIGLALALLLNQKLVGRGIARTFAFAPYVLSGIAVGMLWLYIFDPRNGLLSVALGWFGVGSPQWYTTSPWALIMIIIVYLWKHIGYVALIYLAGLQAVPQDLRDAAALDGAGRSRTFRSVVFPLLGPVTFFLLITTMLSSLQSFDLIRAMTDGGPLGSTTTLMYQIYVEGFQTGRAGYASASATVLFIILLAITGLQLKVLERKVHYS
ncbi:binding-protein-dependent transport systems inner membrane component [Beutenbergia cavernae DSM 12333]|uniref:Binding-protein-dependent transport systems inner membrane component n=1 Tax=Beutenbergia cavernae (strain ATCC BAA-8 / DSM 12333 / CCUG 43141 / JCM 11478 / NBRC 16432 / NCIMB 13614 / HKI 0122) TaxID=471853 RepID=C5BZI5_BEUC1|nr:sugar ABC transporter permease [Beutenbergia cavernae]ACQ79157.1 binding-protein-dependent transport systems inner membrane component [Beutenbergia cavernae DSM 12333]